ncbi:MAG: Type II and III secretion system protein [uncultured Sulfurovum sp.]|uniref:Type II and III secretion system protein n=1 Tax=uncultured Sulfurovum sp. TaxID=269237 RepID=A0A6S6TYI8_9BACT|nr:MAG: Type II and III secretion system protein [uncultured Sulfurovum sp.]
MILLTSCSRLAEKLEVIPDRKSTLEREPFKEFREDYTVNDDFDSQENANIGLRRGTKSVERIPNFQANEFQAVQTSDRAKIKKDLVVSGGKVKVNVESIPLNEFVDFIFSSVLKMNYTVDKNVKKMKQPITLNMAAPLPNKQVLTVVENILKSESVGISQEEGMLFITPSSKRERVQGLSDRYISVGRSLSSNLQDNQKVLMFVPFYYTKPKELSDLSRRLKVSKVKINFLNENIAVLSGEAFDVRQLLELVKIVDSPAMEQKVPYMVELEYIEVKKFVERMTSILESNAIPVAKSIREVGMVLTPIEEINTLLVLSSKKSWVDMLTFWKNKLDVLSEVDTEHSHLYIYKVKHRKADELAEVLQEVLSTNSSNNTTNSNNNTNNNITNSQENNRVNNLSFRDGNQTQNRENPREINIKSDLHTNSLMMNMTPAEYKKILPVIKKLDALPLQVVVEVTLAEVDMTDTFNLGFEWSILNNKAITGTATQVSGAHTLGLGGAAGVTSTLFTSNLTSVINAFAEKKELDILSRPRLVILNNKTGNINVGQQVPVVSSEASATDLTTTGTTPSILRNISYITTGMTLNLTPTINSNGTLSLDIAVTLSEAQTNQTSSIDSPLIVNRSLTTSAVMQSGNSILLGGIISHNKSNGNTGVPLLKEIPWLGNIFKSQSQSHVKTELIILIKPKILENNRELYEETNNFKLLLQELQKNINL